MRVRTKVLSFLLTEMIIVETNGTCVQGRKVRLTCCSLLEIFTSFSRLLPALISFDAMLMN